METKKDDKYSNGKIYTIRSHQTDKFYIGSTIDLLHKRLYKHRAHYKMYQAGKGRKITSFEILKYDDHYIELLENYSCKDKNELSKREGELIRSHKDNCVNCRVEGRTHKEYRQDNKEKIKEYYQDNKEAISEKKKSYYQVNKEVILEKKSEKINCPCGSEFRISDKARHLKTSKHLKYECENKDKKEDIKK